MGKITDLLKKIQVEREEQKKKSIQSLAEKTKELLEQQIPSTETLHTLSEQRTILGKQVPLIAQASRKDAFAVDPSGAVIPREKSGINQRVVTYHDYASPVSEQYRILRTHVKSLLAHKENGNRRAYDKRTLGAGPQIITLTSSLVGEGKSMTCANLAVAFSKDIDSKILLIDCDLRKGAVGEYLNVDGTPGMSEVLQGKCHYTEAVHHTSIPNLFMIPHGKTPLHPSELLGSKNMRKLLEELRSENLNYIILDTPPLMPFTDAALLAAQTDAVFLVVQAQRTRKNILLKAQELLDQAHAKLTGCILNQTDYYIPDIYGSYYYYLHNRYYSKGNGNGNGNGNGASGTPASPSVADPVEGDNTQVS